VYTFRHKSEWCCIRCNDSLALAQVVHGALDSVEGPATAARHDVFHRVWREHPRIVPALRQVGSTGPAQITRLGPAL
jgi:hypothetical protein